MSIFTECKCGHVFIHVTGTVCPKCDTETAESDESRAAEENKQ